MAATVATKMAALATALPTVAIKMAPKGTTKMVATKTLAIATTKMAATATMSPMGATRRTPMGTTWRHRPARSHGAATAVPPP